jgi:hypothetical protein
MRHSTRRPRARASERRWRRGAAHVRRPATTRAADPPPPTRGPRPRSSSSVPAATGASHARGGCASALSCTAPLTAEQQRHHKAGHAGATAPAPRCSTHLAGPNCHLFYLGFFFPLEHLSTINYRNWRNGKRSCFYSPTCLAFFLIKKCYFDEIIWAENKKENVTFK